MAYGNTGGKYVADITVAKGGHVLGQLPLVINTGNVVLAKKGTTTKLDEVRLPSTMANVPTSHEFSAVNRGTAPAAMPTFNGAQASVIPSSGCPATLAPGASCDVTVTAVASWEGSVWDNVYSYTSFNGSESYSVVFDNLPSELVLSTTYLDFGNVAVQRTKTLGVLVSNASSTPAALTVPASAGAFSVEHNCPTSLGAAGTPADTCSLSLTFKPTAEQDYVETFTLQTDLGAASLTVTGRGVAEKPFLEFTEVGSDNSPYLAYYEELGARPVRFVNESVRLKNKGFGDAEITFAKAEESLFGATQGSNAFTFTHNCPIKLAEGASCTIDLVIALVPYSPYRTLHLLANYPNSAYGNPAQLNISLYPEYTEAPKLKPLSDAEELNGVDNLNTVYELINSTNSSLTIPTTSFGMTNIPTYLGGVSLTRTVLTTSAVNGTTSCLGELILQPGERCLVLVRTALNDPFSLADTIPFIDTTGVTIPTSKGNAHRDTVMVLTSVRSAVTGRVSSITDSGNIYLGNGHWRREWLFTLQALNDGLDPYVFVDAIVGFLPLKDNDCRTWLAQNQYCEVTYMLSLEGSSPLADKTKVELIAHGVPPSFRFVGHLKSSRNTVVYIPGQAFNPPTTPGGPISQEFTF
ncbi:choice-of-anchor D domain-containing protein [Nostoc sp. CHAB 5834]|nr:choice-of-anchor D domain-containing protein [Nostoc sp. CHAB 5834]